MPRSYQSGGVRVTEYQRIKFRAMGLVPHALDTLRRVLDELAGVQCFIDSGTLLGLYRDGQLIHHDTDLDIAVLVKDPQSNYASLDAPLLRDVYTTLDEVGQRAYSVDGVVVDLAFFHHNITFNEWRNPTDSGTLYIPAELVEPLDTFMGFPVPHETERYLAHRYGPDWQTPKTKKSGWDREAYNLRRWAES